MFLRSDDYIEFKQLLITTTDDRTLASVEMTVITQHYPNGVSVMFTATHDTRVLFSIMGDSSLDSEIYSNFCNDFGARVGMDGRQPICTMPVNQFFALSRRK